MRLPLLPARILLACIALLGLALLAASGSSRAEAPRARGIDVPGPWATYYGAASKLDMARAAQTYRLLVIDADPDQNNFTPTQIAQLRAGGRNRVLSYLNIGSCERFRSYWNGTGTPIPGCGDNTAAHRGTYEGYSNEVWMDPSHPNHQRLILEYVAPRLVAQGIDGFYLDNMEIVEHGTNTADGPCNTTCRQGGLDLVRKLRERYPNLTIVMQNAAGPITRDGRTGRVSYASLLDGIAHESVFAPSHDAEADTQLAHWRALNLRPGGRPLWIGTLDYVGNCKEVKAAHQAFARSRARGYTPAVSDASAGQQRICDWPRPTSP